MPILQSTVNQGYKLIETNTTDKRGNLTGKYIQFVQAYAEKGINIVVKVFYDLQGNARLEDAWGLFVGGGN